MILLVGRKTARGTPQCVIRLPWLPRKRACFPVRFNHSQSWRSKGKHQDVLYIKKKSDYVVLKYFILVA